MGYITTGIFHLNMFIFGALGSVTAVMGFQLGEKLRNKINAKTFRNLLLAFFSLAALKMIIETLIKFNFFKLY